MAQRENAEQNWILNSPHRDIVMYFRRALRLFEAHDDTDEHGVQRFHFELHPTRKFTTRAMNISLRILRKVGELRLIELGKNRTPRNAQIKYFSRSCYFD